jgi:L-malate glycosyltransferase
MLLLGDARQVHLRRWASFFLDRGYDVLTLSLEAGEGFPGTFRRIAVSRALPDALRYPAASLAVRGAIRRFRPHVVSAHFVPNYGLMAALLRPRRWVVSAWGSDVMTDPAKSPFHRWRVAFVLRRAPFITSDAEVLTERIRTFGVERDRILTFPYGVDEGLFHPSVAPPPAGPRVLSNRRLDAHYRVDTVIDAFPAVREALPDATLTIAGDGNVSASLRSRAQRSPAASAITFAGALEHGRMPSLLREHHLYVSTSPVDSTSVSLLEAMASGLFPVVTDIPANREWIVDGENGRLVPAGEAPRLAVALIDSWRDGELRERARRRNLEIISERGRWRETMRPAAELFDALADSAA